MAQKGPYTRRSARILLVDDTDRVLLLRFRTPTSTGWVTPGGGVEAGETLAQAAVRELREEIGLATTPADLGGPVAVTAGRAELGGVAGLYRDDFYFLRVRPTPSTPAAKPRTSATNSPATAGGNPPTSPPPATSCTRTVWRHCSRTSSPAAGRRSPAYCPGARTPNHERGGAPGRS
ncbi:hypothetical protein GCM10022220_00530 [Actinocatenispora rupis]|uniref:Nudix hydrolase domain-containing protein n=1 Tax=Actinocatenispora rupis TaxID=519421 RepID=A0A8J3JFU8_9ACTN|nr:hypothetical protein Aru02nite_50070 [Actinocatenispora rupis]